MPSTARAALTRAVAAGDLQRVEGEYLLGERLLDRQRRQDEAAEDADRPWGGAWEMAVVTVAGRSGAARAALRETLSAARLAELREGVWTRPANLRRNPTYKEQPVLSCFQAHPDDDPATLASALWDLPTWAKEGERLVHQLETTQEPPTRLAAAAYLVRHLATDPLLPRELLPPMWPGGKLRTAYLRYQAELRELAIVRHVGF
ncbi:PaaX family transcriptional regulator C-terminal domain-containing protein [Nocardioides salsibiostraticola]